jgi:hypothetical protein
LDAPLGIHARRGLGEPILDRRSGRSHPLDVESDGEHFFEVLAEPPRAF